MKLKVFRDLEFYGNENSFSKLVEEIERNLSNGWKRSREDESQISNSISKTAYCFRCSNHEERKAALLWMMDKYYEVERDYETLYVANIVPVENQELNYDQYNFILKEFYEKFAKPVADKLDINSKLTSDEEGINDWFSSNVEDKLIKFSRLANKNTGSAHPSDEERWFDFITSAHQENSTLSPDTLQRWLTETEKWSGEVAWNLANEYELLNRFLRFYDKKRYDK